MSKYSCLQHYVSSQDFYQNITSLRCKDSMMFPTKTQCAPGARQASDTGTWTGWHTHGAPSPGHRVELRLGGHCVLYLITPSPVNNISTPSTYITEHVTCHNVTSHGGFFLIALHSKAIKMMLVFQFQSINVKAIFLNHAEVNMCPESCV